jgi:rod shape-determining protein MreD
MRWMLFLVFATVAIAIDTSSLVALLSLPTLGDLIPTVAGVVIVFVGLYAPRSVALWSAWVMGVLVDLVPPAGDGVLLGPHALGYVLATVVVLQVRTMVFRRRVLTICVLTFVGLAVSVPVEVLVNTVRMWHADPLPTWEVYRPWVELLRGVGNALYTALIAIPVGWLLVRTLPLWGFQHAERRV